MDDARQREIETFIVKLWLILAFFLFLALVYFLRMLVLLTFLSVLLAMVWSFLARALIKVSGGKLPRIPAVLTAILLSGGILSLLGFLLFEPLNEQLTGFFSSLPETLQNVWMRLQPLLRRFGLGEFDPTSIDLQQFPAKALSSGFVILGAGVQGVSSLLAVTFLAFFWAIAPDVYRLGFLRLLASHQQAWAVRIIDQVHYTLKQWMKATALSMLTIAILTTVFLWIVGIPYALLFGIAAGFLEIVPFVGPFLAFIGPILIALSMSPATALWVVAGWMVVQTAEGNLVQPYFLSKAAELPPALTVFAIFAMGELFGLLGMFVAAPTLALVVGVVRAVYSFNRFEPGTQAGG